MHPPGQERVFDIENGGLYEEIILLIMENANIKLRVREIIYFMDSLPDHAAGG